MKRKILIRCLFCLGLAMVIFGGITGFILPYIDNIRAERISKELTDRYGLVIRYGEPSEFFVFPLSAEHNSKAFHVEPVDKQYVLTAMKGIKSGLSKYPPALIRKYLTAVFISGAIKRYGVQGSGTYIGSWIYVSALPKYDAKGEQFYAETIHHELSSIFLNGPYVKSLKEDDDYFLPAYGSNPISLEKQINEMSKIPKFPRTKWSRINEPSFEYLKKEIDVIRAASPKRQRSPNEAPSWYKAGFVDDYGMSSLENDLNTYAEIAMVHPEKLKKLAEQYPRIAAKTKIFVAFYTALAPELGDYFKSVGLYN